MRIKLDENLPAELADDLRAHGHDVDTVPEEGLTGLSDRVVARASRRARRVLFTLDKGMGDVRRFPPREQRGGIVLFRLDPRGRTSVRTAILGSIGRLPGESQLVRRLTVVTESTMRTRR